MEIFSRYPSIYHVKSSFSFYFFHYDFALIEILHFQALHVVLFFKDELGVCLALLFNDFDCT